MRCEAIEPPVQRIVLVVGDCNRAEMRPLAKRVEELVSESSRLAFCPDVRTIFEKFSSNEFPDLIVVLQSWSDEYSSQEVNQLLAYAPLARLVVCYGAWCESDGRNRNIWPVSIRVPVWSAQFRIQHEWQSIQNPAIAPPHPLSASREEVFAVDRPLLQNWLGTKSIAIDSPDSAYQQFLQETLFATGCTIVRDGATVLLFDADPWEESRIATLNARRADSPNAILIALVSSAMPNTVAELQELGFDQIIHKLAFHHGKI